MIKKKKKRIHQQVKVKKFLNEHLVFNYSQHIIWEILSLTERIVLAMEPVVNIIT